MSTISATVTLATEECIYCGMPYAISSTWKRQAMQIGNFKMCMHCPYCGKTQGYGESAHEKELKRLAEERDRALRDKKWHEDRADYLAKESDHFRKSRDGMKGALQKVKTRIANSTCPCCNRHFPNDKLAKHIKTKHPGFKNDPETPAFTDTSPLPPAIS